MKFFGEEQTIFEEIREWSKYTLKTKSKDGFFACPFAKTSWDLNRVGVVFKHDAHKQCLYTALSEFNNETDVVVIVDLNYEDVTTFHQYLESLNDAISQGIFIQKDLWVMGFHPDDDANESIDDGKFDAKTDVSYAMIFIQRLTKVQLAAHKLKLTDYYVKYFEEKVPDVVFGYRESFYRRLLDEQHD